MDTPPPNRSAVSDETHRQLAYFAAIVESSDDAIIGKDLHSVVTSWNKGAEKIFGYTAAEMIGQSIMRLIPADRQSEEEHILSQIKAGQRIDHFETIRLTKDNRLIHVSVTASPIKDMSGTIIGASKVARDISDQKNASKALLESESRFQNAFNGSPVALAIHSLPVRAFVDANPAFLNLVGCSRDEVIGHTAADLGIMSAHEFERLRASLGEYRVLRNEEVILKPHCGDPRNVLISAEIIEIRGAPHTITTYVDITERKQAADARRASEARYRTLFEYAPEGILIADTKSNYLDANAQICRMLGYAHNEIILLNARDIVAAAELPYIAPALDAIRSASNYSREWIFRRKDGSTFPAEVIATTMPDGNLLGIVRDISERQLLESQLRQAQKMEAVGQFAAGVAHDFNNQITVVLGFAQLIMDTIPAESSSAKMLQEIINAGDRSAALTQQLLAFSRKQVLAPKILNLNDIIQNSEKILRRMIGEDMQLVTVAHPSLDRVKADPGQLEQVIFNLAVNARDAMPRGGKLTIETNNVELDANYAKTHAGVIPGNYVMLAVSDSGSGMTAEIQKHIFEPFFTTKGVGKGTGLGLAVVHGIIKQSGGNIEVYSEPDVGTSFKIYFPRIDVESLPASSARPLEITHPPGTETILLVEDEEALRTLSALVLRQRGYTVLDASNGDLALKIAADHAATIHLLVTDVVMPGLGGRLLAEKLVALHPEMKVLYMSGYTDDAVVRHGILQQHVNFLRKPFTPAIFSQKIREVLQKP